MPVAPFTLGPLEVPPGQTRRGEIPFARTPDGRVLGIPVTVMRGARPGPVLCLNSGTHGDEPEGTFAILDTLRNLEPSELAGTIVAIPVLNVMAFIEKTSLDVSGVRETPVDRKNLARVFPGNPHGTVTERLAAKVVETIIPNVDAVIDFHSGGTRGTSLWITGFIGTGDALGQRSLELASQFPIKTLWRVSPWSKFSAVCIEHGVPVAVVETTGQGRADPADVEVLTAGIRNVLLHLKMIEGVIGELPSSRVCIDSETYVFSSESGILRSFVTTGDHVREGSAIGEIMDAYGTVVQGVVAPHDGLVTGIRTKPVVWAGEPLFLVAALIDIQDALQPAQQPNVTPP